MHTRGRPQDWPKLPPLAPDEVLPLVLTELAERIKAATAAGIPGNKIVLDPGFGFGKRYEENYPLLRRFQEFHDVHFPLLAGVSRKSFIGRMLARNGKEPSTNERLFGTLGAEMSLALKGGHIIRTHDVRACAEALKLADIAS